MTKKHTVSFIFADSAEQVLNNSLNGELRANKINLIVNTVETIKLIFFKLPLFKDTSRTEVTSNPQLITIEKYETIV